jgi:hypothetical protein
MCFQEASLQVVYRQYQHQESDVAFNIMAWVETIVPGQHLGAGNWMADARPLQRHNFLVRCMQLAIVQVPG